MKKPSDDSPQPDSVWVELDDFEYICFNLARKLLTFTEPIPEYNTTNISLLDSALSAPKARFGGKLLYPTLEDQASVLFYSLIKNHPFINGNKRVAVITLLVFLVLNKKWIRIPQNLLYKLAVMVAESDPRDRDFILKRNAELFKKFIIQVPKPLK